MQPGEPPNSQFGDNPLNVAPPVMPPPPAGVNPGNIRAPGAVGGNFNPWNPTEKNQYGGQQIAGADPSQADYGSVQGYADDAHQNAMRYLQPQIDQQNRRMQQDLINKGIDPNSQQGRNMQDQLGRQQADAQNAAAFGALQFGQGIQNQMFGQEQQQAQLAGDMQKALWGTQLGSSGQGLQWQLGKMDSANQAANRQMQAQMANAQNRLAAGQMQNQYNLGMGGLGMDKYRADLGQQLGMGQLDMGRNQMEHGQMMDLLGYDMGVRQYNDQQQMMQDAMFNQWYGNTPIPGMSPVNPYGPANTMMQAGDTTWWQAGAEGSFGFSDRRLKENIVPAGNINGVNVYHYNFIGDDVPRIGPMAQEVPHAAVMHPSGYLMVNMNKLF